MSDQLTLPLAGQVLTTADLDEWIRYVDSSGDYSAHLPYQWARDELARLLGQEFPYRVYGRVELLQILRRTRAAHALQETPKEQDRG